MRLAFFLRTGFTAPLAPFALPLPNSQPNRPTTRSLFSMFAVIDEPSHLGAQVLAVHDAIDETVLQQELAGLESFRKLKPHRVPDGAPARETNHRAGFRQGEVALQCETRRDAAHGRIG